MIKIKLILSHWLANVTRKLKHNFYIYLAVLFSILVILDASIFHVGLNMRDKAFDFMVKNRIFQAQPDQQIIIVDINEASLAALSKEYGRWPWPRQVLGEFVENIQAQQPSAIVFDIVFSDADIYNPDSDAYFDEVISQGENVYFPIMRLDQSQDSISQLKYKEIPGLAKLAQSDDDATVAAILPFFKSAIRPHRLGTHNVYPDNDGIVREYRIFHDDAGWVLPSLPLVVGNTDHPADTNLPQNMLINWRGKPFSYHYVNFSDVFTDLASQHKTRPANEFTNKIVIIGSTAPGLFDIKPTAMDKQFPGVEILATAIDNVKHRDYLKVWRGKTPYVLLSLLLIWSTTLAFYLKVDREKFNSIFTGGQIGLLVLSYIGINFTNTYLDLTGPILWAVALFGIAKIYALATERALQRWLALGSKHQDQELAVTMLAVIIESREVLGDALMKVIKRRIELIAKTPCNIEHIHGTQSGIWGLFGDMLVISWVYAPQNTERPSQIQQDILHMMQELPKIIDQLGLPNLANVRYSTHEGKIAQHQLTDAEVASQWRTLFAQAVIKLEQSDSN